MKKVTDYLLVVVMLFALQGCSKDDEPKHFDPERISGEWYITNVRGWEYVDDEHTKKSEFNETFDFNGKGVPVGENAINAQKGYFRVGWFDSESGSYYIEITSYYWIVSDKYWRIKQSGEVRLKDNQLIDGTMKVTITKLTDTNMTTYQKNQYGETYITYSKQLF